MMNMMKVLVGMSVFSRGLVSELLLTPPPPKQVVTRTSTSLFAACRRSPTSILLRESHVEKLGRIQEAEYEILNVLEFNSVRKRQSVVCRFPDGRLVLYCKVGGGQMGGWVESGVGQRRGQGAG